MEDQSKEIERLRLQVKNLEKLSSLGMLSAGIAHEIQNPLNFVINFSKLSSNLKKIEEHGNRATSIIRGILLYSRGKDDEYIPTDIKNLVKEYVWLAYHSMRANYKGFNIAIREHYEEGLPMLKVIPQDLSRAVLNVMNNACYAVYSKSKLSPIGYEPVISVDLRKEGDSLRLSIEDNGIGMPENIREQIFSAFFTTKPVGEGTGLGLSITRSIIEENYGDQDIKRRRRTGSGSVANPIFPSEDP